MSKYRSYTFRLVKALIILTLFISSVIGSIMFDDMYGQGFSILGSVVFGVLSWNALKALLDEQMRICIAEKITKVLKILFKPLYLLAAFIRKKLGITTKRIYGIDEKSFFFTEKEKKPRAKKLPKRLKLGLNAINAEAVRYYYSVYLLAKIKSGCRVEFTKTPNELAKKLIKDTDEKIIFDSYNTARYCSECDIDDKTVEEIKKIVSG